MAGLTQDERAATTTEFRSLPLSLRDASCLLFLNRPVRRHYRRTAATEPLVQVYHRDVKAGRDVEREHLRKEQTAHHRAAERPARFGAHAGAEGAGQGTAYRRARGHHDGTDT